MEGLRWVQKEISESEDHAIAHRKEGGLVACDPVPFRCPSADDSLAGAELLMRERLMRGYRLRGECVRD